jgi:hypothetical protein
MNTSRNTTMGTLGSMEPRDRDLLLSTEPAFWLGKIIQLNQQPRYHNSLDAIALLSNLNEVCKAGGTSNAARS